MDKRFSSFLTLAVAASASLTLSGAAIAGAHEEANAADQRGDFATELRILQPEAVRGQPWAENNLGNMYLYGNGVRKDEAQAFVLFSQAAQQRDAGAEMNLGQTYEWGWGVVSDLPKAAALYRRSGEDGKTVGWTLLKRLCDRVRNVAPVDCAKIPKGTRSASYFNLAGKPGLLVRTLVDLAILALAGFGVVVAINRYRRQFTDARAGVGG